MDDRNDEPQAQNVAVEEQTVDEMPTSETAEPEVAEVQSDEGDEVETEESESDDQEQVESEDDQEDRKPTRAERNLYKTLEKNKNLKNELANKGQELDKIYDFLQTERPDLSKEEVDSLFTPEDLEQGAITDPKEFESRINKVISKAIEQDRQQEAQRRQVERQREVFTETVTKHTDELGDVLKNTPELQDSEVQDAYVNLYESINYIGDQFIGRMSPKEVLSKLLIATNKVSNLKSSEVTGEVIRRANDEGIIPSNASTESPRRVNLDDLYQTAINSSSDEDWTAYFKAKSSSNKN